jgi:AcrR family transcriptional regulator
VAADPVPCLAMTHADAAPPGHEARPRVGRPPRINRQMIAEAAHELGLDGLTLKAVADHLDVSIAALYHHVTSKDDLMRVAAEYAASRVPLPVDRGQHWAVWLYEWGAYNRDVFLARPGLLARYVEGAIPAETIAGNVDRILGALVAQGFSVYDANEAYELVTSCALGTAVAALREREAAEAGVPVGARLQAVLDDDGPDGLPHLRALLAEVDRRGGRQPFQQRIASVLCGIAVRRGEDAGAILAVLDAAHPATS